MNTNPHLSARQVEAVAAIWEATCHLPEPPISTMILSDEEFLVLSPGDKAAADILQEEEIHKLLGDIEKERVFLSEDIWSAFHAARSFAGRIHVVLRLHLERPAKSRSMWHEDAGLKQIFCSVLTEVEYDTLLNEPLNKSLRVSARLQHLVLERCLDFLGKL